MCDDCIEIFHYALIDILVYVVHIYLVPHKYNNIVNLFQRINRKLIMNFVFWILNYVLVFLIKKTSLSLV